jgi:hypothetical protein
MTLKKHLKYCFLRIIDANASPTVIVMRLCRSQRGKVLDAELPDEN